MKVCDNWNYSDRKHPIRLQSLCDSTSPIAVQIEGANNGYPRKLITPMNQYTATNTKIYQDCPLPLPTAASSRIEGYGTGVVETDREMEDGRGQRWCSGSGAGLL